MFLLFLETAKKTKNKCSRAPLFAITGAGAAAETGDGDGAGAAAAVGDGAGSGMSITMRAAVPELYQTGTVTI